MLQIASVAITVLLLFLPLVSAVLLVIRKRRGVGAWATSFFVTTVLTYALLQISTVLMNAHLKNELARLTPSAEETQGQEQEDSSELKLIKERIAIQAERTSPALTGLFTCPLHSAICHALIGLPYLMFIRPTGSVRREKE